MERNNLIPVAANFCRQTFGYQMNYRHKTKVKNKKSSDVR
nr:MAG TPA: hypothetical protein [Caudoviricetes sp.]DAY34543.1 MAG TPA: hypothetical protein [Caudoviricetes sp.]